MSTHSQPNARCQKHHKGKSGRPTKSPATSPSYETGLDEAVCENFTNLCSEFPGLSEAKIKEEIFVAPDIRKLISDEISETTILNVEQKHELPLKMY
jgi:hypothetical protein